jgi:hypothetical protein
VNVARHMWVRYEPYHDVTYFTPESRAATDALGCKGGWMGYFGMRAAPLGAVSPEVVTALFYSFHPRMVFRALPDAWAIAPPQEFLTTRLHGVDGALRRMLGEEVLTGKELTEAADLAKEAAQAAPTAGRPLAAANAALPWPDEPHLALWQATAVLRESRGDGHVAALVAAGLDPCQALVLFGAEKGLPGEFMQKARGWSEPEWAAAVDDLRARGLVSGDGALTAEGAKLREWVEERTDRAAEAPWQRLGSAPTERLAELLEPLALRLADDNQAMKVNPMALDPRAAIVR